MLRDGLWLNAAIGAFVAGLLMLGGTVYAYSWEVMRFPALVGAVILVLVAAEFLAARRATRGPSVEPPAPGPMDIELSSREILVSLLWVSAILPPVLVLGFPLGLAIYCLLYLRAHGIGWPIAAGIAAGVLALTYFVFIRFLQVPLPVRPLDF